MALGIAVAAGILWMRRGRNPPEVPVEALLPSHVSAAVRFAGFEDAFALHWLRRGHRDEDKAVEEFLKAVGVWESWVEKYEENGSRARIRTYKKAIFRLFGEETWLVFGEWAPPGLEGTGEVALLLYFREGSAITARIGPLAKLLFPDYKIRHSEYRGKDIYEYVDADDRRAITLANIGGWVCASLWSPGRGPVVRAIDQYYEVRRTQRTVAPLFAEDVPGRRKPALTSVAHPERIWGQLRQFSVKRERPLSERTERLITKWSQRLESIDEVRLAQTGDSLLNLDFTITGPRIENLAPVLVEPPGDWLGADPIGGSESGGVFLSPNILQVDFAEPFAVEGLPIFGVDWEAILDDLDGIRWISPKLVKTLERILSNEVPPPDARFGLAFYSTDRNPIPVVSVWEDKAPFLNSVRSPADAWRLVPPWSEEQKDDFRMTAGRLEFDDPTTTSLLLAQRALADGLWASDRSPPVGYLCIHFDELGDWMRRFPTILLGSKDRARWKRYGDYVNAFRLAGGSASIRIDRKDRALTLKLRTLELSPPAER